MTPKPPPYSDAELSSFEVKMLAHAASTLGVLGAGYQQEADFATRVAKVDPQVPVLIKDVIERYRDWSEAIRGKANERILSICNERADMPERSLQRGWKIFGLQTNYPPMAALRRALKSRSSASISFFAP